MSVDYYIYYRIEAEHTAALAAAVADLQAALLEATGITGRLRRRLDDPLTWMEIYEQVADGPAFEAVLDQLVTEHALLSFLAPGTTRTIERFRRVE